mmetsp:Transcript_872/g.2591  ORF Transcript_872/g.2591 Transcript_872/m.2591 type:complete len:99 (+) Transcript_872:83-379(+)
MSLQDFQDYVNEARKSMQGRKGERLPLLEFHLEEAEAELGLSKKKMKEYARATGLCLSNFVLYGSPGKLRRFLRDHPSQISREKAKEHKLVKFFLVRL